MSGRSLAKARAYQDDERRRVRLARIGRAVEAAAAKPVSFRTAAIRLEENPGAGAGKHGTAKQIVRHCLVSG